MEGGRGRYKGCIRYGGVFLKRRLKMHKQGLKLLANIISVYLMSTVFSFIEAREILYIITFSFVLWLLSLILRPLLLLIFFPINILTLGIFSLLINTWMIMLTDTLIKGVHIPGFWLSFTLAVIIMMFNNVLKKLFMKAKRDKGTGMLFQI